MDNLQQLREAIDKGLMEEAYMLEYMQQMHDLDYSCLIRHQLAPPEPSIEQLSYSGLHAACLATSVHPPTANTPEAIAAARAELNRLNVRWQLDLALYLWVSISFLALAGLALQLRHLQGQLTILVREIAIQQAREQAGHAPPVPASASVSRAGAGAAPPTDGSR